MSVPLGRECVERENARASRARRPHNVERDDRPLEMGNEQGHCRQQRQLGLHRRHQPPIHAVRSRWWPVVHRT